MKYEKEFYVIGAVYRLFSREKVDKTCAVELLIGRAKIKPIAAKQTVEIWSAYPKKLSFCAPNQPT